MLVCWADGTNDSLTKRLMLQVPFFIKSGKILILKIKSFDWPKSVRNYEKKNTWNVRCLVDESFVPTMALPVVEFSRQGYKIGKVFA